MRAQQSKGEEGTGTSVHWESDGSLPSRGQYVQIIYCGIKGDERGEGGMEDTRLRQEAQLVRGRAQWAVRLVDGVSRRCTLVALADKS